MFGVIFLFLVIIISSIYFKDSITYSKLIHLIQSNINSDNIAEAIRLLNKIPLYKREKPFSKWLNAQIYFKNGQYFMAMTKLQDIMMKKKYEFDLNELEVRKLLIEVYNKTNRYKEAFELLESTLKMDPNGMYLNREMGKHHFNEGDYTKARYFLITAVNAGADDFNSLYFLSKVEYERGSYVDSLYYVEKALEINPNSSQALFLYALLKFNSKNYTVSDKAFSKLLIDENYKDTSMLYKSICLYNMSDIDGCIEMANNVFQTSFDKNSAIYLTFLKTYVDALIKNKKILRIETILDDILKMYPDDIFAINYKDIYMNVFKNPDTLLGCLLMGRIEIKDKFSNFLSDLNYEVLDFALTDEEEYFFHACEKEFSNSSILFVFSRGENYIELKEINDYINLSKTKKSAILYVTTPFYFMDECYDITDNKITIKLYDGSLLAKVLNNEIEL